MHESPRQVSPGRRANSDGTAIDTSCTGTARGLAARPRRGPGKDAVQCIGLVELQLSHQTTKAEHATSAEVRNSQSERKLRRGAISRPSSRRRKVTQAVEHRHTQGPTCASRHRPVTHTAVRDRTAAPGRRLAFRKSGSQGHLGKPLNPPSFSHELRTCQRPNAQIEQPAWFHPGTGAQGQAPARAPCPAPGIAHAPPKEPSGNRSRPPLQQTHHN